MIAAVFIFRFLSLPFLHPLASCQGFLLQFTMLSFTCCADTVSFACNILTGTVYKDEVKEAMEALRRPVDELEMLVDKEVWPYPTYADLMFEV